MKLSYIVSGLLALFTSSCDRVNDDLGETDAGAFSEPSLIAKCEACGNAISKQAEECPTCGHPNPIFITEEKRRAKEAKRLAEVEEKSHEEAEAKRLKEMERKALAKMETQGIAEEEAKRQDEMAKALAEKAKERDGGQAELKARGGSAVLAQIHRAEEIGATYARFVSNGISDISPLAELTKLEELDLWNNRITDVSPLAKLTNLEELDLWGNQITDVTPLAGLKNLTKLVLVGNQVTDLTPLARLNKLTKLYLPKNQITDLAPLANLKSLTKLVLLGNQITDVKPLTGLNRLTKLHLPKNQITDIAERLLVLCRYRESHKVVEIEQAGVVTPEFQFESFRHTLQQKTFGRPVAPDKQKGLL